MPYPELPPLSLYIHIPWCIKKCPYCDFNSHEVKQNTPEVAYVNTLLKDLERDIQRFKIDRPIQSIFIGGGTPSLFAPASFERLLAGISQQLQLTATIEITLEANPGTFESQKFEAFRALGINRLSIGIQTFNDAALKRLGRVHSGTEAIKAVEIAHQAGFDNFNLDLMFGLPDTHWQTSLADVTTACALTPTHLSLYQLTLEPNTFFHRYPPVLPDDETLFNTQLHCQAQLAEHGFEQYEVSAYSQPNKHCRHNVNYWQFGDYLGIGAGAHGKISQSLPNQIVRSSKPKHPEQYIRDFSLGEQLSHINESELPLEYVMNQLRIKQGFSLQQFTQSTGLQPDRITPALQSCLTEKLLEFHQNQYRCTEQGWHFLDSVLEKFFLA